MSTQVAQCRRRLGLFLLPGLFALLSCASPAEPRLSATRGYILISIDTLRADHLTTYGYDRDTSPNLDALARRGVLFERAFSQIPATLESHMSIFTGLYPAEHGVESPTGTLSPDIETLPEVFQRHGFSTAGHTEGGYVHGGYGFERGFDEFSHESLKVESDIERTLARGTDFLAGLAEDEPFFLFLHTYAVHDPYYPEEPWASRYWQGEVPDTFGATGPNLTAFNHGELEMPEGALEYYEASYDGSIRYADEKLGEFFAEVSRLGLDDEITVIVTSDHGEEFREHGKMVHEQLYRETLHVPLILLHPDIERPQRVETVVQSIDIAPTFHRLAGLTSRRPVSGRDLTRLLDGREENRSEAFARAAGGTTTSLIRARGEDLYQLIHFAPSAEDPWIEGSRSFDISGGRLRLEVLAYHETRELAVSVDDTPILRADIFSDRWTEVEIAPTEGERHRVTLSSSTCAVPAEVSTSRDPRCLSFRTRGAPMMSAQLFDLRRDPAGSNDLAADDWEAVERFVAGLTGYDRSPLGEAVETALDPDLEQHLKSLGYLQ